MHPVFGNPYGTHRRMRILPNPSRHRLEAHGIWVRIQFIPFYSVASLILVLLCSNKNRVGPHHAYARHSIHRNRFRSCRLNTGREWVRRVSMDSPRRREKGKVGDARRDCKIGVQIGHDESEKARRGVIEWAKGTEVLISPAPEPPHHRLLPVGSSPRGLRLYAASCLRYTFNTWNCGSLQFWHTTIILVIVNFLDTRHFVNPYNHMLKTRNTKSFFFTQT